MKPAHALALALIPMVTLGASVFSMLSQRIRDALFLGMVFIAVFTERLDVHFFSMEWYRGSTRGIEISLVEMLAFAVLAGTVLSQRHDPAKGSRWYWPASLGLLFAYFGYSCLSVLFSPLKLFGVFELTKIAGSILVFLAAAAYLRTRREWSLLIGGLAVVVAMEGAWAVKQRIFTHLDRAAGTLDHPNSLSMYFCLTAPLLAAFVHGGWSRPLRWLCGAAVGLATVGEVLAVSRAGIPVFFVAVVGASIACAAYRLTPRRAAAGAVLALAAGAIVASYWGHIKERYTEVSLDEEYFDPNVEGRGVYFRLAHAIAMEHPLGVGLNNWSWYVSSIYGPKLGFRFVDYNSLLSVYGPNDDVFADSYLAPPAHNLGALTLGELGYPGLLLFTVLWLRWMFLAGGFFRQPRSDPKRTMGVGILFSILGIFGQSLTEWVYRQSPILYTFYILLGGLAAVAYCRTRERRRLRTSPPPEIGTPVEALQPCA